METSNHQDPTSSPRPTHRRTSSASRYPAYSPPEPTTLDVSSGIDIWANIPSSSSSGPRSHHRTPSASSHHRRTPSNQSDVTVGDLEIKPFDNHPDTSHSIELENLHLTPPPTSSFAPKVVTVQRSNSNSGVRKREKRKLVIPKDAVFRENEGPVFVIYSPSKEGKVHITQNDIQEIELDPHSNKPGTSLWQVVFEQVHYSRELQMLDCDRQESYLFHSTSSKRPIKYHVTFSHLNPEGLVLTVDPTDDVTLIQPAVPMTFVQFPRDQLVVFPAHAIGSAAWWRLPRCKGRHLKPDEEDGSWTGRWDVEAPRRPSRCVSHFAECEHRRGLPWDGLGQLARAIRAPAAKTKPRARRKSEGVKTEEDEDEDDGDGDEDDNGDTSDAPSAHRV
ncbi:hypothetical protein P7C70_g8818, partial [Phenoliferia sp. Uapishka_3]